MPPGSRLVALKHVAKRQALRHASAWANAVFGRKVHGRIGILMYHRVTEFGDDVCRPTWNVTPQQFRRQMTGLLARGFEPWPLRWVIDRCRLGLAIPPRTFVVTFDDGYESVHRRAWPVLREFGVPATIFLPTAYLGRETPFPFDDWRDAGSSRVPAHAWRLMSTEQCRELATGGLIDLGAHTHTHRDFRNRPAELAADLSRCLEYMRKNFGLSEVSFAFPFGYAEAALANAAKQPGILCGLTAEEKLVDPASDPFAWGRFEVDQADSAETLAACLDGWCDAIRSLWRQRKLRFWRA
jgi:peptidoglycan/xylan/chitin deacetylase (PgdA/CDA1 family)